MNQPLVNGDMRADETPTDGFGPGFIVYQLASYFHALCCVSGPEHARQEMAEIINAEFDRKRITIDG